MIKIPSEKRIKTYLKNKSSEQIREDLYQAQDFIYDAYECFDEYEVFNFIKKALKKSPLCADAYTLYVQTMGVYNIETISILRVAVFVAEKALVEPLSSFEGVFWGDIDTRPYMRAKALLAHCLWEVGFYEEAINKYEELLKLNPNDNQGVRYILADYYLELERIDKLKSLFESYNDEYSCFFFYTKALVAYKEKDKNATSFILEAIKSNPYVVRYLMDKTKPVKNTTSTYMVGGEDEAIIYVSNNIRSWLRTPNAIEWLVNSAIKAGFEFKEK